MDENEFDQKIRENALLHESRMEKPLWNKDGIWNRIDSGLGKKETAIWWKVAAMILFFLSAGWSYAQWNNFRKFKVEKEVELSAIQLELQKCMTNNNSQLHEGRIIIQRQNMELDSLKKQISWLGEISRKKEFRKPTIIKNEVAEIQVNLKDQKKLIDSLQTMLRLEQTINTNTELARIAKKTNSVNQEIPKVSNVVSPENQIYFISTQNEPQNLKKEKGFKIGIFGLSKDENIQYKSDHSIFKK